MCGGTELLAHRIVSGETQYGFNPQGAKHHAHRSSGGGFCVFNDMALAAHIFMDVGMRVAYLDLDAHHGDGVEALLQTESAATTASIHEGGIFPGTGLTSVPEAGVHNWPLPGRSGDEPWLRAVGEAVEVLRAFHPGVLLVSIGADAHEGDPLSSLKVTEDGYLAAGRQVGDSVRDLGVPLLMGGAGGYQPLTWTPRIWTGFVIEAIRHTAAWIPAPLGSRSSVGESGEA
jgi:acetoin utilization protein AcuC